MRIPWNSNALLDPRQETPAFTGSLCIESLTLKVLAPRITGMSGIVETRGTSETAVELKRATSQRITPLSVVPAGGEAVQPREAREASMREEDYRLCEPMDEYSLSMSPTSFTTSKL